jgi:hypothetical protein
MAAWLKSFVKFVATALSRLEGEPGRAWSLLVRK